MRNTRPVQPPYLLYIVEVVVFTSRTRTLLGDRHQPQIEFLCLASDSCLDPERLRKLVMHVHPWDR